MFLPVFKCVTGKPDIPSMHVQCSNVLCVGVVIVHFATHLQTCRPDWRPLARTSTMHSVATARLLHSWRTRVTFNRLHPCILLATARSATSAHMRPPLPPPVPVRLL